VIREGALLLADYTDQDVAALKALAGDKRHERALRWIINEACLVYDEAFVPGQPDMTANRQGRRSAGLQIVKLINLPPKETPEPLDVSMVRKRAVKGRL